LTVRVIEPLKLFRPWTVTVAVPEEPTSIEAGETAPIEMEKSGATVTVTGTSTVLLREPLVPVTVIVKLAAAVQVTERTFPLFRATVHWDGIVAGPVIANETAALKALAGWTEIVDVPALPVTVIIEVGFADRVKSTTWNFIAADV
jgi:hypothetical protein